MQLLTSLSIIFVAVLVSCRANLVGYDDLGVSFNLTNYNFQFQTAQYEVNGVQVFNANISSKCLVAVSPELSQQMVFVNWPSASAAGCKYFIDVIQQYASNDVAVPSVLIFTSTSFHMTGLREPYQDQLYLSGNQASFNPPGLSLAIVSRSDGETLNSLTFPLIANISSSPSLVTVEFYAAPFQTLIWILVTCFIIIALICFYEVIALWVRLHKVVFNARRCGLLCTSYTFSLPILAVLCSCAAFFGSRILITLKTVGSISQSRAIIRTITCLLLGAVGTIFVFIVVLLYQTISGFSSSASLASLAQSQAPNIVMNVVIIFVSFFGIYGMFTSSFGRVQSSNSGTQYSSASAKISSNRSNKPTTTNQESSLQHPSQLLIKFSSEIDLNTI